MVMEKAAAKSSGLMCLDTVLIRTAPLVREQFKAQKERHFRRRQSSAGKVFI